ncbi:MAG: AmmeMemoRadiSam system protein A [Syntrophobacterales bacterium]
MELSAADQELLFKVARDSIKAHLKGEQAVLPQTTSPVLSQPRGLFVTLNRQGRLRGCIGYLEAVIPVLAAVQEMALAAAFRDPRFPPLREEELADLEVEISILSPMRLIKDVDEIQVGRHGLFMARGPCRGLLLPQVATEYGWDRFTFLQQTCRKAGLPADAWKDPATKFFWHSFWPGIVSQSQNRYPRRYHQIRNSQTLKAAPVRSPRASLAADLGGARSHGAGTWHGQAAGAAGDPGFGRRPAG